MTPKFILARGQRDSDRVLERLKASELVEGEDYTIRMEDYEDDDGFLLPGFFGDVGISYFTSGDTIYNCFRAIIAIENRKSGKPAFSIPGV